VLERIDKGTRAAAGTKKENKVLAPK
jgi:hypothetical protein